MYEPVARQRACIEGREGVYFILAIDEEADLAYVIKADKTGGVVERVAVRHLKPERS
jgi:hypothetical protein